MCAILWKKVLCSNTSDFSLILITSQKTNNIYILHTAKQKSSYFENYTKNYSNKLITLYTTFFLLKNDKAQQTMFFESKY